MLHTSIGIGIGYWYRQWPILLDIGWLSWYRSNPSVTCHPTQVNTPHHNPNHEASTQFT